MGWFNYTNATEEPFTDVTDVMFNVTSLATNRPATPPPVGYYGDLRALLWRILAPIIMLMGLTGNCLTVLVLLHQERRKMKSTSLFLLALALSDTIILFSGPLRNWIINTWGVDVRLASTASCRAQLYTTYCSIHLSSWLLVAVTWERSLSVLFPHRVKVLCTSRKAVAIILVLVVIICGIDIMVPVMVKLDGLAERRCSPYTKELFDLRNNVYEWIDFTLAFAAPFPILVIGNVIIVWQLHQSRARRLKMSSRIRDTRPISMLMVALCMVYFLSVTPAAVMQVLYPIYEAKIVEQLKTDPYTAWYNFQYLLFVHTVTTLLSHMNAAVNFLLYVFSGSKFRQELMLLFRGKPVSGRSSFAPRPRDSPQTVSTKIPSITTQLASS
ncbi:probable G-protein coupled receptor 139 [Mya arenaria]|uniref:probable G-protein coupled receptor 139 n=1 Tax=Mya arenaria TaxID=6604 RepID=UPI0022E0D28C|nr:probable G-protein coupled receptor 139 [Mya arenaria]